MATLQHTINTENTMKYCNMMTPTAKLYTEPLQSSQELRVVVRKSSPLDESSVSDNLSGSKHGWGRNESLKIQFEPTRIHTSMKNAKQSHTRR